MSALPGTAIGMSFLCGRKRALMSGRKFFALRAIVTGWFGSYHNEKRLWKTSSWKLPMLTSNRGSQSVVRADVLLAIGLGKQYLASRERNTGLSGQAESVHNDA